MTWRASTVIENADKTKKLLPPTSSDLVVDFLRTASTPTAVLELVHHLLQSCKLDHSQHGVYVARQRVQRSLNHLRDTGVGISVAVPGWRKYLWALKEREEEFWPKGKPQAAGNYTDTAKIMEVLRKAPGPLPVTDIIDQVAIAFGERPRTKRTHHLGCRIRGCLHFHREQGAVIQVVFPGTQKQLWLLASRKDEFLPGREVGPNNQIVNDSGVLSILASATAPMTAPEIAKAVVLSKGELPTDRNISLAVSRVRQHLRKFFEQGLVREVRIQGSRFGGWLLTEQAKRQLAA